MKATDLENLADVLEEAADRDKSKKKLEPKKEKEV